MWKTIIEISLKIASFIFTKIKISKENKKEFIEIINKIRKKENLTSVRDSVMRQIKRLKKK